METTIRPITIADSQTTSIGTASADLPVRSYPPEVVILGQVHRNYQFTRPVALTIERDEDGSYVLSDDIFGIFGNAFSLVEAVRDYISAFVGYYELLSAHQDAPSVALFQEVRRYFQAVR